MADTPTLTDHVEEHRFEAHVGRELAGFVDYRRAGGRLVLIHTEVLEAFAGRGIGAAMARWILDSARESGIRVTLKCPFIRAYVARHPDYADIVTPDPGDRSPRP